MKIPRPLEWTAAGRRSPEHSFSPTTHPLKSESHRQRGRHTLSASLNLSPRPRKGPL